MVLQSRLLQASSLVGFLLLNLKVCKLDLSTLHPPLKREVLVDFLDLEIKDFNRVAWVQHVVESLVSHLPYQVIARFLLLWEILYSYQTIGIPPLSKALCAGCLGTASQAYGPLLLESWASSPSGSCRSLNSKSQKLRSYLKLASIPILT